MGSKVIGIINVTTRKRARNKGDFTDLKDLDENSNPGVGIFWLIAIYGPAVIGLIVFI